MPTVAELLASWRKTRDSPVAKQDEAKSLSQQHEASPNYRISDPENAFATRRSIVSIEVEDMTVDDSSSVEIPNTPSYGEDTRACKTQRCDLSISLSKQEYEAKASPSRQFAAYGDTVESGASVRGPLEVHRGWMDDNSWSSSLSNVKLKDTAFLGIYSKRVTEGKTEYACIIEI